MGALLRCPSCSRQMVIESYHTGREVPCPWCRARTEVPAGFDFAAVDRAQARDEGKGGLLLVLAVIGFFGCLPLAAWAWWSAHGVLSRAADEGRPGDGLVRAARVFAAVGCVVESVLGLVLLARALG